MEVFILYIILFSGFILLLNKDAILNYRRQILWILLLGMYGSFSVLGYNFFLPKDAIFMVSPLGILVFVIMTILMSAFIISIFILIDLLKSRLIQGKEKIDSIHIKIFFCQSFIMFAIIWTVFLILVFPGIFNVDSFFLLHSIVYKKFNNYFSAFFLWILNIFYKIIPNPFFPILSQVLFAAWVFSLWTTEFYRKKISRKIIWITSGLFALYPPVAIFIVNLFRDVPYSLVIVWLVYFIYQIVFNDRYDRRLIFIFGLVTPLVHFFRQNGIIVVVGIIIFILFYRPTKRKILYFFLGLIISYTAYQTIWTLTKTGPDRSKNLPSLVVTAISNSYIYRSGLHSPAARDWVEKSGNTVQWISTSNESCPVNPFHNVPLFLLNSTNERWNSVVYHEMSKKDIMLTYFSLWRYDFKLNLRTRLNLIANFWSINIPDSAIGLYLVSTLDKTNNYETPNINIHFRRPDFIMKIHHFLQTKSILYFIGGGFYTFLLLIIILYILCYQNKQKLWLLVPWFCNFLSLFAASTAVQYRYIWIGLPMLIIMVGMVFIHNKKN
ncbi:hypothetical protein SAMN02745150_00691 [Brevinema andersonii]|uniref:Dolichyl-phosphate-mannose-protein mannosyltransferase n=1 Tax=Brevinema andersonii TaxID=34097 RepID=A0A1I1DPK2_BREAD|nr:hypothetical protein [Brevinema andersonii]SFB76747.1 hypothetical protein SAMN02745150_00691 [Brevinema andersonii]